MNIFEWQNRMVNMMQPITQSLEAMYYSDCMRTINYNIENIARVANTMNVIDPIKGVKATVIDNQNEILAMQQSALKCIEKIGMPDMLSGLSGATGNIMKLLEPCYLNMSVIQEQINFLSSIDYRPILEGIKIQGMNLAQIANKIYESEWKEYDEEPKEQKEQQLEVDFKDNEEIKEVFKELTANPKGLQERVGSWAEEKKRKYYIVTTILVFLWGVFIEPYLQEKIGLPVMAYFESKVKELPEKAGKVIGTLKEDVQAVVIGNERYYYKVTFIDENGEKREGYVAKRNVKVLIDEDIDIEQDK